MDEKSIIERIKDGDKEAYALIVEKYKNQIFNICCHYLQNHHDANDAAQETFIKAYKSINGFNFKSSFATYLVRIAINTSKDYLKKGKKHLNNINIDDENAPEIKDDKNTPEDNFEQKERQKMVRDAILKLNKKHREMIILRDINGYSYIEIANALKISEGTVKSRINRVRDALKEIILKNGTFL